MPFGEYFDDPSPPLIQSDLLGSVEKGYSREQSPIEGEGMGTSASAGPTVVTLDDQAPAGMSSRIPEADMGVEDEVEAELEVSRVSAVTSSITRKRGRPSLSGSATPAKLTTLKTPRSTKSVATVKSAGRSTGRKRTAAAIEAEPETTPEPKAESESEPEAEPARKRGRPARTVGAAASARLAAKAAKKPTRGRPKSSTVSIVARSSSADPQNAHCCNSLPRNQQKLDCPGKTPLTARFPRASTKSRPLSTRWLTPIPWSTTTVSSGRATQTATTHGSRKRTSSMPLSSCANLMLRRSPRRRMLPRKPVLRMTPKRKGMSRSGALRGSSPTL
ncbi:hypothetical protein N656DRAFT_228485 [Canariomyces notabilis]|uniref:Uncharacterized protein n=1 Tax=Canariomyces notabilis TaxID=2074819 RepID=A0AAN6TKN5_9PEZI|nr:hypothetical protein N656DRAFT_228485 [Canariomyces arenarius]